jgi:hypothetical protein
LPQHLARRGTSLCQARRSDQDTFTEQPTDPPLALTDDQLDLIMRCAAPLDPQMRHVFVEHVAYALRGKTIGDGEVWRACVSVLREAGMFVSPIDDDRGAGRRVGYGSYT